jgi:hypothetical protein
MIPMNSTFLIANFLVNHLRMNDFEHVCNQEALI